MHAAYAGVWRYASDVLCAIAEYTDLFGMIIYMIYTTGIENW